MFLGRGRDLAMECIDFEGPIGVRPSRRDEKLICGSTERTVEKGGYFFLPAAAAETTARTTGGVEIVECLSPSMP